MSRDEYKDCPNAPGPCFCPGTCQEKVDAPEPLKEWPVEKDWPERTSAPWKLGGP